jgi:aryl-alcohol dehydrogenase-like predicted oxidoreductase
MTPADGGGLPQVRFGRSGPYVTKLGFGGIPIQQLPEGLAVRLVRAAYDAGMRFFDTAHGYTNSEERIGKALAGVTDQVFLVTKSPARDAATLEEHFTTSLKRMQVERVDLFLFHNVSRPDHQKAILEGGLLEQMRRHQAAGRVGMIGVSSHQAKAAADCVRTGEFAALEFPYNYLEDQAEPELLPLCREHGIGFIAMKPLAGGALSSAAAAIKWLMRQPEVVAIPGLMAMAQLDEVIAAAAGSLDLTAAELAAIERDRRELRNAFCRRCGYCLPCPQGIAVNTVISAELFLNRSGWSRADQRYLDMLDKAAQDCLECGICQARCPYELPLASMVRPTAERLARRVREVMASSREQ